MWPILIENVNKFTFHSYMSIDRRQDMFRTAKWLAGIAAATKPDYLSSVPETHVMKRKTWILHVFWPPHACCSRHAHTTIRTHNNNKNLKTLLGRYTWWLCPKLYQLFCPHFFQVSTRKVCDTIVLVSFLAGKGPRA